MPEELSAFVYLQQRPRLMHAQTPASKVTKPYISLDTSPNDRLSFKAIEIKPSNAERHTHGGQSTQQLPLKLDFTKIMQEALRANGLKNWQRTESARRREREKLEEDAVENDPAKESIRHKLHLEEYLQDTANKPVYLQPTYSIGFTPYKIRVSKPKNNTTFASPLKGEAETAVNNSGSRYPDCNHQSPEHGKRKILNIKRPAKTNVFSNQLKSVSPDPV